MNPTGDADLLVATRSALLEALEALHAHRRSVIVIGAQAIYFRTGAAAVGLAEATKDSDLALDTRTLLDEPLLERAMTDAGFCRAPRVPHSPRCDGEGDNAGGAGSDKPRPATRPPQIRRLGGRCGHGVTSR